MMRRRIGQGWIFVGLLTIMSLVSTAAFCETVKLERKFLEYHREAGDPEKDPVFLFRVVNSQSVFSGSRDTDVRYWGGPSFDSIIKGEPKYVAKEPFFGVLSYGTSSLPLVLDKDKPESKGFQVMYFDSNGNGDLSDEKPVRVIKDPRETTALSPITRSSCSAVVLSATDGVEEYRFSVRYIEYEGMGWIMSGYITAEAAAYWEGDITVGGKQHRVVLVDYNSNGRYDDKWIYGKVKSPTEVLDYDPEGDVVYVDPDLDDRSMTSRGDRFPVSEYIVLGGKIYELKVSQTGDTLSLEQVDLPTGVVKNGNRQFSALVYGDKGVMKISSKGASGDILPAGKWTLQNYTISADDGKKEKAPTFVSANVYNSTETFDIREGKTTEVGFGPPFKCVVRAASYTPEKSIVRLSLSIEDSLGIVCSDMMVKGKRPTEPSIAIASSNGKIIERGRFEYG